MSTRRLASWVESEYRPTRPMASQIDGSTRFRATPVVVMMIGMAILRSGAGAAAGRDRADLHGRPCGRGRLRRVARPAARRSTSRPSRWAGSSRPARLDLSMRVTDLPSSLGLGDRVVQPGLAATLDEVQAQLGGEGCRDRRRLRARAAAGSSGGDRVEQLLGGEVEPGELLGGEHADREPRRRDGALHEHAVELDLHHPPEAVDDRRRRSPRGSTAKATAVICGASQSASIAVPGGVSRNIGDREAERRARAAETSISVAPRRVTTSSRAIAGGERRGGVAADVVQVPDRDEVERDGDGEHR